jgi:tetratricopeptide (TPR) repeat protein
MELYKQSTKEIFRIDYPKSLGVSFVGWFVSISNILLFVSYYYILITQQHPAPPRFISFLAMAAVFPRDFFHNYLSQFWMAHFCWMIVIIICAFGILLLNQFARMMFILMNVFHAVVSAYLFFQHMNKPDMLDYFFTLYFNYAFIFAYVGFITIPEVRGQFRSRLEGWTFSPLARGHTRRRSPNQDALGYYHLALAYGRLHRYADAATALQKAIHLNSDDNRYYYELGINLIRLRKTGEAISAFKQAVRFKPNHFEAIFQLAQLYQQEGCGQEAVAALEKAQQLQPNNSQVYQQLGKAYMLVDNFLAAAEALQKSLQLNSRDPEIYYQLGWLYLNRVGKIQEAREILKTAVHLRPKGPDGHFQLGMACLKLQRYKEAVRAFKDVIFIDEQHRQAHYQLGFTYVMLKDSDSARRESSLLRSLDPELADKLNLLISAANDS